MCIQEAVFNSGSSSGPLWDIDNFALSSETDFSSLVKSSGHLVCPGLVQHCSSGQSLQGGSVHRVGFKAGSGLSRELRCVAGERTAGPGWAGARCMSPGSSFPIWSWGTTPKVNACIHFFESLTKSCMFPLKWWPISLLSLHKLLSSATLYTVVSGWSTHPACQWSRF